MPIRPRGPCRVPTCPGLEQAHGYCSEHQGLYVPRIRDRGPHYYGREWIRIREEMLTGAGIPPEQWRDYDIDHEPRYDPAIQPDHRAYRLTIRRHGEHSKKTAKIDGGYGNPRR